MEGWQVTASEYGNHHRESDFGYRYFDDPEGDGYRGYYRDSNGDGSYLPWEAAREFCLNHRIRTAVDWGCAKGFLVAELRSAGIDAVGYDVSGYALSHSQGLPCYQADIRAGVDRTADAMFALGVLLYLEETELPAVLSDLHAHTTQYLLVSSYYSGDEQGFPDPLRRITRTRQWWRRQIKHAGFQFKHEGIAFDVYTI